ncbi:MAG: proton-conducting transporter membrane subunit, partial [Marmoricola sp.]
MITPLMSAFSQGTVPVVNPTYASGAFGLLWLVIALPALGAVVLLVGGRRTDSWGHLLGCATVLLSFVLSLVLFFSLLGRSSGDRSVGQHLWNWFTAGNYTVRLDILYDPLSALFLLLITGVGGLIHVYSVGYLEHDVRRRRFFGYLNLFIAAMLTLVLASDYVGVFLGWEGVGLASYLLIGFWQHKTTAAVAAKKAFVVNRVGDFGIALVVGLMFATFGTTSFAGISALSHQASS